MRGTPMGKTQSASEAVIDAVARRAGVDPLELSTPLYDAVDPDELDALLDGASPSSRSPVSVTFRYHGYTITIDSDLTVTVAE